MRRILAALGLALAFMATQASAQSLTTYTFATLPGSPTAGQLAWITDNSGTPTVGSPAAGGAAAGNRDLVAYDATQTRWEFVARQPTAGPTVPVSTLFDAVRIAYANGGSGATSADVQSAIDELFGLRTAVQPTPSVASDTSATRATISNPASVPFGFNVAFAPPNVFTSETYDGSGVPAFEPDNMAGFSYNKLGIYGSTIVTACEHAFDDSWELSYRDGVGTNDETWVERNWDMVPPALRSTVTGGAGFNPAVGSVITFSGGGTGKVLAWNSGTGVLDWMQNFGCVAAAQTVTGTGGTKTLGTITSLGQSNYALRPFQFEWNTLTNVATWHLRSVPASVQPADAFRVANVLGLGVVAINTLLQPNAFLGSESRQPNLAAIRAEYISPGASGNGNALGLALRMDLSGAAATANSHSDVALMRVEAATQPGAPALAAFAVNRSAAIEIMDQKGVAATDSAVLRIMAQTATGAAPAGAQGNVAFLGGNWNNGHLVLGGYGYNTSGDHVFFDQTNDKLRIKVNAPPTSETDGTPVQVVVVSGTRALATSAISAGACSTTDASITATGALSTDRVQFSPNADPGVNAGLLTYAAWAGSNVISFRVCNPSAGSITPGAVTMNWAVVR